MGPASSPTLSGAAFRNTVEAGAKPRCGWSNRPEVAVTAAIAVAPVTNRTANKAAILETLAFARIVSLPSPCHENTGPSWTHYR